MKRLAQSHSWEVEDAASKPWSVNPKFLKNAGRDCSRRSSPVYVGRVVSGMVSECRPTSGDNGDQALGCHGRGNLGDGESQLGDLVCGQTRCTQMRVRPCGPAKQFIHSFTQQVFIKCYPCPRHQGKAGGRHEWSLTS